MNVVYKIKYVYKDQAYSYLHELASHTRETRPDGYIIETYHRFLDCEGKLRVNILRLIDIYNVERYQAVFFNESEHKVRILDFDVGIVLNAKDINLTYYISDWGSEFYPQKKKIESQFSFGSLFGRSCKGFIPWVGIETEKGYIASTLAWSGNWTCNFTPIDDYFCFTLGYSSSGTFFDIHPNKTLESALLLTSFDQTEEYASLAFRRYFRDKLRLDRPEKDSAIPITFNAWWPYEDKFISEDIFIENATKAKEIGLNFAILDAGWFGNDREDQSWFEKRGDWYIENIRTFPDGIKKLFNDVALLGISPGIWCEIEAVGKDAALNISKPEIIAKRDDVSLGYVCFGFEQTREWAFEVIDKLVTGYGAKWIKFDFNLDPGKGCNSKKHDHGEGDGLYSHFKGYYMFLKRLHEKYPELIIENCSSGGLRMDIEMLSYTHVTHLSDPDYTDFHLQCFWGALSYLHQSALLHFSWSEVLGEHNKGIKNPVDYFKNSNIFDFMIRANLMGVTGFSYKLIDLPQWCIESLRKHTSFYKKIYKDFIFDGDIVRLTKQPLMGGRGERFPVFQLTDRMGNSVIFAFRLQNSKSEQKVVLMGLIEDAMYEISDIDEEFVCKKYGRDLTKEGILINLQDEMSSEILMVKKSI